MDRAWNSKQPLRILLGSGFRAEGRNTGRQEVGGSKILISTGCIQQKLEVHGRGSHPGARSLLTPSDLHLSNASARCLETADRAKHLSNSTNTFISCARPENRGQRKKAVHKLSFAEPAPHIRTPSPKPYTLNPVTLNP